MYYVVFTLGNNFEKQQTNIKYNSVWNNCVCILNELLPANNKKKNAFLCPSNPIFFSFLSCYILGSSSENRSCLFHSSAHGRAEFSSTQVFLPVACLYLLLHLIWAPWSHLHDKDRLLLLDHSISILWDSFPSCSCLAVGYTFQRVLQDQCHSFMNQWIPKD